MNKLYSIVLVLTMLVLSSGIVLGASQPNITNISTETTTGVDTTEEPVDAITGSVDTTEEPIEITTGPVETTAEPAETMPEIPKETPKSPGFGIVLTICVLSTMYIFKRR